MNCTANRRGLGSVRLYWLWLRVGDSKLEGAPGVRHPSEWRASHSQRTRPHLACDAPPAIANHANGVRRQQPRSLRFSCLYLFPGAFKPERHQVRASRHAARVELAQLVNIHITQLAAHFLIAKKRRIPNDAVRLNLLWLNMFDPERLIPL